MGRLNILAGIKLDRISGLTKEVQNELDKVSKKVSLNIDKVNLNNIDKSINELKNRVDSISSKIKISPDFDNSKINSKISNFENRVTTMQSKLKSAFDGGFINESELQKLQQSLNNLNVDTPVSEFKELQLAINSLGKSENQIVRLDKIINQLESNLKDLNSKKSIDLMTESELSQLNEAKNSLAQLKTLKASVEGGNAKSTAQISNAVNEATRSMSTFENSITSSNRSASGLVSTFKNIASYAIGGSLIYGLVNEVKEGISTIVSLDTAMRDLRKVSSATTEELSKFTDVANKIGIEVGASTKSVIEATTYYSKLGYAIDEATQRAKNATIFSNVADMNIDDASKSLITIQKGFNLNTLEDMTRIMDVANEVGNNYSSTSEDVANGLRQMGNALSEAGNSYEQSVGIFVAGNASIQDSEKVGNAIKTLSMRLRGMKTEIDETSIPVSKLRDVIKQLTADAGKEVDIMLDENTFKSTYQQMTELSEIYPKLTDGQKAYLQYVIAGQRQGNIFSGIMSNMTDGINAYNTALNSSGSAQREQELYLDSIEGKMNAFKETLSSIWVSLISSEDIKSIVSGGTVVLNILSKIIEVFGGIPTVVAIATGSIVAFNKASVIMKSTAMATESMSTAIGKYGLTAEKTTTITNGVNNAFKFMGNGAIATSVKTKVLDTSLKAVSVTSKIASVAISSVFSMGISLLITSLITKVMQFADSIVHADEKLKELNDEFASSMKNDANNNVSDLIDNYKSVENQLKNVKKGTQEYAEKEQELQSALEGLLAVYPDAITYIDEDTNKKMLNVDATQKLIDKNLELSKAKANEVLDKNNVNAQNASVESMNQLIKNYEDANEKLKEYNKLKLEGKKWYKDETGDFHLVSNSGLKKNQEIVEGYQSTINALLPALKLLKDDNKNLGEAYNVLNGYINQSTESLNANKTAKEQNSNVDIGQGMSVDSVAMKTKIMEDSLNSLGLTADEVKEKMKNIDVGNLGSPDMIATATESYGKATAEAKSLYDMIEKINEAGSMTPDLVASIASKYPDIGGAIFNVSDAQEFLNQKIAGMESIQNEAYQIMMGNNEAYYSSLLSNADEAQSMFDEYASQFVDVNSSAYNFDVRNYRTLNEAKAGLMNSLNPVLAQWLSNLVGGSASQYEKDLQNFTSLAEQKAYVLQKLNQQMSVLQGNFNNLITSMQNVAMQDFGDPTFNMNGALAHTIKQIKTVDAGIKGINTSFSEFNRGFGGGGVSFNGADYKGTSSGGSKPKGGSSKPPTSKSKEQVEKDARDYEAERIKAEEEANKRILDMRNELVNALKKKYEEMREAEIKKIDAEIDKLKEQLDRLENGYSNESEKLKKLKAELELWKNDDSAYSQKKQYELQEEIAKSELRVQIEAKEKEKETIESKYDKLLEDSRLYQEADKLLKEKNYKEIQSLLTKYGDYFKETTGSISDYVKDMINQLKEDQKIANGTASSSKSSSSGSSSSKGSSSGSSTTSTGNVKKGSKVKVKDLSSDIYVDSSTSRSSGSWKGAGIKTSDGLYVVNDNNGRVALSRTNNINGAIGWIKKDKVSKFKTGGMYTGDFDNGGIPALLHKKELVLNQQQTEAFTKLVPYLEDLEKYMAIEDGMYNLFKNILKNIDVSKDSPTVVYKNEWEIYNNGSELDTRRLDNNIEKVVKSQLRNGGVKR